MSRRKAFLWASGMAALLGVSLTLGRAVLSYYTIPCAAAYIEQTAPDPSRDDSVEAWETVAALESMGGSEHDPVVLRLRDLRRLCAMGPAAKGEIDDRTCRLRTLLTPANVADVARSLPSHELSTPGGAVVLETWLTADPQTASAWIATRSGATDHHAWLVAEALARQQEELAAFCHTLDQTPWAQTFLDYTTRELLRSNPAAAASLAESLSPGERQTRVFETIASDWALRDPGAARTWINGVNDPNLRHRLIAVGAQSAASTDPLGAVEWLLAQSPPDAALQEPLQTIAGIWRHTAGPDMADWLDNLAGHRERRAGPVPRPH